MSVPDLNRYTYTHKTRRGDICKRLHNLFRRLPLKYDKESIKIFFGILGGLFAEAPPSWLLFLLNPMKLQMTITHADGRIFGFDLYLF